MRRLPWCTLIALLGCQNYDLHVVSPFPVAPVTTVIKVQGTPYIMIVEDTSGSMCEPIDQTDPTDSNGCDLTPANSKLGLVSINMQAILPNILAVLKSDAGMDPFDLGVTGFPNEASSDQCAAPTGPAVAMGAASQTVPQVGSWYATVQPGGGTPTAQALAVAAAGFPTGLARYVFLLTDGLPNCNPNDPCVTDSANNLWSDKLPHGCESQGYEQTHLSHGEPMGATAAMACQCSNGPCLDPATSLSDCCTRDLYVIDQGANPQAQQTLASEDCLDDVSTVAEIASLRAQGIDTYVIGMGMGITDPTVLNAMAQAGGSGTALIATSPASLQTEMLQTLLTLTTTCQYTLSAATPAVTPASAGLIEVDVGTTQLPTSAYTFDPSTDTLTILGSACMGLRDGMPHTLTVKTLQQT